MAAPSFFRRRRARRRRRRHPTHRRREDRPTRARETALVRSVSRIKPIPTKKRPSEFKNLRFDSFNCEGLSPQSKEEIMEIMSRKKVDVMLLQETWSPDPAGRWITPTGYLFLLHGAPRKADSGRRTCGVGFVLSPSAIDAWEAAGAPFVNHPSSDGCARLASIRLFCS